MQKPYQIKKTASKNEIDEWPDGNDFDASRTNQELSISLVHFQSTTYCLKYRNKILKYTFQAGKKFICLSITLRYTFAKHQGDKYPRNVAAIHRIIPIYWTKIIKIFRKSGQLLENFNLIQKKKTVESVRTFMPSTTNKCNVIPNRNSLNHLHARRADSMNRDDFNDIGTK